MIIKKIISTSAKNGEDVQFTLHELDKAIDKELDYEVAEEEWPVIKKYLRYKNGDASVNPTENDLEISNGYFKRLKANLKKRKLINTKSDMSLLTVPNPPKEGSVKRNRSDFGNATDAESSSKSKKR